MPARFVPKIRNGFNQEQKEPSTLSEVYQPDFLLDSSDSIFFTPVVFGDVECVTSRCADLSKRPTDAAAQGSLIPRADRSGCVVI